MQIEPVVARPVVKTPRHREPWGCGNACLWVVGVLLVVGIAAVGCLAAVMI